MEKTGCKTIAGRFLTFFYRAIDILRTLVLTTDPSQSSIVKGIFKNW